MLREINTACDNDMIMSDSNEVLLPGSEGGVCHKCLQKKVGHHVCEESLALKVDEIEA